MAWRKPPRPPWLDPETYRRRPAALTVREVQVQVEPPGFRTESLVVVTSLVDADKVPRADVADLYRRRWTVELHLRDIKSTMHLDVLRCKTPERVRQELWTGLLAYNLIRQSLLQSAQLSRRRPEQLSFTATRQSLATTWLLAAVEGARPGATQPLLELRVRHGASHVVGNRPNRVEPRAKNRRPNSHPLLRVPRKEARARLLAKRTT